MRDDFAIFIMSYKRANNICTLNSLDKAGYTGKWYIVVGDDDPMLEEYKRLYKNNLFIFNKKEIAKNIDLCDNGGSDKVIVYARNYCFEAAKSLGLKYFAEFDDDYDNFEYRYIEGKKLLTMKVLEFDKVVDICINFLEDTNAKTIAFAQNGDFIGGYDSSMAKQRVKRKTMNSFFCKTNNPFKFNGRINEDVNTYVTLGSRGELFLSVADIALKQKNTQTNKGGMSETYIDDGTYLKSFYTVITNPSCTKIAMMITNNTRIHHRISWNNAVPKIISGKYKK